MIGVFSPGIARIPNLEAFLGEPWQRVRPWNRSRITKIAGWGMKRTSLRARDYAEKHDLPYLALEDGFLRSQGIGPNEPPISIVIDDLGIYYDATRPSRLEELIKQSVDNQSVIAGLKIAAAWRAARVSKYNHQPDRSPPLEPGFVLVVDQTYADASVTYGLANEKSFKRMLEAALDENPERQIVVKTHPDVVAGIKRGYLKTLNKLNDDRIFLLSEPVHPPALLQETHSVYCVTSQFGFEALLWKVPVRTFAMPFYAGWGLTFDDVQPPAGRRGSIPLGSLVYAALASYPKYFLGCDSDDRNFAVAIKHLASQLSRWGECPPSRYDYNLGNSTTGYNWHQNTRTDRLISKN